MNGLQTCIGQIVQFVLTEDMCKAIYRRRDDAYNNLPIIRKEAKAGYIAYVGYPPQSGEIVPMIITRVWDENLVNGQIILDGNDHYWATSVARGPSYGEWEFPESFAQPREDLDRQVLEVAATAFEDGQEIDEQPSDTKPAEDDTLPPGTGQETAAGGNKQAEQTPISGG